MVQECIILHPRIAYIAYKALCFIGAILYVLLPCIISDQCQVCSVFTYLLVIMGISGFLKSLKLNVCVTYLLMLIRWQEMFT